MKIIIRGEAKEIAALVLEIQERQMASGRVTDDSEERDKFIAELTDPQMEKRISESLIDSVSKAMQSD